MYVTDTHGLIWFLTDDKKLGKKAEEIFLSADRGDTSLNYPVYPLDMDVVEVCQNIKDTLSPRQDNSCNCKTVKCQAYNKR